MQRVMNNSIFFLLLLLPATVAAPDANVDVDGGAVEDGNPLSSLPSISNCKCPSSPLYKYLGL